MRKVTIGCKGDPNLKWELVKEAELLDMSLSEYMESILENRQIQDDVKVLRHRFREEQRAKEEVFSKLEDYEQQLEELFQNFRGKELPFREPNGRTIKRKVNSKLDLLEAIVASIKAKK